MKTLLSALLACLIVGCDQPQHSQLQLVDPGLRVITYEGHQYLFYKVGYGAGLCHLESCTNSHHGHPESSVRFVPMGRREAYMLAGIASTNNTMEVFQLDQSLTNWRSMGTIIVVDKLNNQ